MNVIILFEMKLFEIKLFEIDLFEMKLFHAAIGKVNNNKESYVLGFIEEKFDISNYWAQKQKDGKPAIN